MEDRSWQALYVTNDVWVTDSLEVSNLIFMYQDTLKMES